MNLNDKRAIWRWMRGNAARFVDECDEVNCTAMVEAWDHECASGADTLDTGHVAWDVAVDVAGLVELELTEAAKARLRASFAPPRADSHESPERRLQVQAMAGLDDFDREGRSRP
jgi:hypothetical protein